VSSFCTSNETISTLLPKVGNHSATALTSPHLFCGNWQ
jgi:hypothetical protein